MTVQLGENGVILLIDSCPVEDADFLLKHLLEHADASIDWARCTSAHTSVIQVILASGLVPVGVPKDAFLKTLVGRALDRSQQTSSVFPGSQEDAK
jgi:hypothetical protein